MDGQVVQNIFQNPIRRIYKVIRLEKNEISSVYFYAMLNGLIQLSLPLGIQSIISFILGGSFTTSLVVLICLVVGGVLMNGVLQVNQMRLIEKVQQKIFVRYSLEFAERIPKLNLQAVDGYYLPELVNRFFDTVSLQKGISKLLLDIPAATIQIFFGLLLMSFYHPVFIFFGLLLLLSIALILRLTAGRGMASSIKESDYKYAVSGWLQEMARVAKSLKFARQNTININKTDQLVTGYLQSRTTHFKVLEWQYWSLVIFKVVITAAMLIVGSLLLVNQQLNIGQFIAAEIVILMVITSVEKLIINLDNVYDVLTSVEKLGKVTDKPIEEDGNLPLVAGNDGLSIQLTNVSFSYTQQLTPAKAVLKDINLRIEKNHKVCIMGRGGSGKSSLLRLLTGSYKDFTGNILINDIAISNYHLGSLRAQMGTVFSQQDIFEGSLFENLSMGNDHITRHQILALADKIGLKKFMSGLPAGLDARLHPAGRRMPQKITQKLLLLRALLDRPSLLLLEEPFDGIEEEVRQQIIDFLLHQTPGQTVVVISNDIAFAALCDQVIYLEEGRVKAAGKWNAIQSTIKH
jgi:ABC-type bacteriocin/lantibiotic exporter with double-glycine peptidase domain